MITESFPIEIQKTPQSRIYELEEGLKKFGRIFSDHMFVADYKEGKWENAQIIPYGNFSLSPATSAIHYGQAIFEGLKAYKNRAGEVLVFRPFDNMKRMNKSAERMCMATIPEELFKQALFTLLKIDRDWVPQVEGSALYIRPFMFATDEYVGIKPSDNYKFSIIMSPVGAYYSEPVRVKIETFYSRSVEGGTGTAKAAGNYAASLYPAKLAQEKGYHQLVWTDAKEHKYIEESGTMNIMFVIDGVLVTPPLSDTILHGITRDSVLKLARHYGIPVEERKISVDEIIEAHNKGLLQDMFGTGTAATIAHVQLFNYNDKDYELPPVENREFSNRVKKHLDKIKTGEAEDIFNWTVNIDKM
ncbi:MAG: branched-chain amino acid aminotransferase [Bacteroidetes bacterium]|nr:MAG: branched-chain amino acid aminotransferase [Bacteroidota bacterium]